MGLKKVSIIIPVKPGGEVRALYALRKVDYPADGFEVLVSEGVCPSRQRNLAAGESGGDVIYFLDDDSMVSPGSLHRVSSNFDDTTVAVAGGPSLTPESDPPLRQAFGLALSSTFGGGSVRNRYRQTGEPRETGDHELILCNLAILAKVFRASGGFDERLYPNEENELLVRLAKQGWKLLHDPDLAVFRGQRSGIRAFVRQLFGYGRGRAQQILLGGGVGVAAVVSALFIIYLLTLPFIHLPVYYLPLLCYLGMSLLFATMAGIVTRKPVPALFLPLLFPLLHISYGTGLLLGLIKTGIRKRAMPCSPVEVKRVKEFNDVTGW